MYFKIVEECEIMQFVRAYDAETLNADDDDEIEINFIEKERLAMKS